MPRPDDDTASPSRQALLTLLNANSTARACIPLNDGWQYAIHGSDDWQPAQQLPTSIHLDLQANGIIPDSFPGKNEEECQWVESEIWVYRKSFELPADVVEDEDVFAHLVLEGLDTYATVTLDGQVILQAEDMFMSHRVDIARYLRSSQADTHLLEIRFEPAEAKGNAEVDEHPEYSWTSFNSGAARLATRKAQYHYGWDWGPKLMTCGPWRPVSMEIFRSRVSDVAARPTLSDDLSHAEIVVDVETEGRPTFVVVNIEQDGVLCASEIRSVPNTGKTSISIPINNPKLWWPHTHGAQNFYTISADIYAGGQLTDNMTKRIGLRRVELVRQPLLGQEGTSFFFRINNQPIFAAGSNWIPGDMFTPRMTPATYQRWLTLAKASNQVMIRVWGGGIYEPSASFYATCDDLGLLVWQDFMFACGMFPTHTSFLDKITAETTSNLRALRHHPSIVLWCGNNEDYVIPLLSQIEYDAAETDPAAILASPFPARYIYEHIFPKLCAELVPGTPYWPGSPFGGAMVNSVTEGDCHQWHVWHLEKFPYQEYRNLTPRFASEFGMQGIPCTRTVEEFFPERSGGEPAVDSNARKDWVEDEFVDWHNKCPGGHETLGQYVEENLEVDGRNLRGYVYATQLVQSEAVAAAYRAWRREWRGPGKEYCGGALVWQMNDCYPVTSWALADYKLRPKMAYWALKRECAPIAAGLQRIDEDGRSILQAWATNSTLRKTSVTATIRAWNVIGGSVLWEKILHATIALEANQTTELDSFELGKISALTHLSDFKAMAFSLELTSGYSSSTPTRPGLLSRSISFHEPLKEVPFGTTQRPEIHVVADGVVQIVSDVAMKGVLLEVDDGDIDRVQWDDNGFDLVPGVIHQIAVAGIRVGDERRIQGRWLGGSTNAEQISQGHVRALL